MENQQSLIKIKRKGLCAGCKVDNIDIGDIVEFTETPELVVFNNDQSHLVTLLRVNTEIHYRERMVQNGILINVRSISQVYFDSTNLARKTVYDSLDQLLNKYGITK